MTTSERFKSADGFMLLSTLMIAMATGILADSPATVLLVFGIATAVRALIELLVALEQRSEESAAKERLNNQIALAEALQRQQSISTLTKQLLDR